MRRADACAARAPGPDGLCLSGGGPIAIGGGRWRLALAARRLSPWDWTIAPARARVHPCCSLAAWGFHAWRTGFGGWARARVWGCVCACACLRVLACARVRVLSRGRVCRRTSRAERERVERRAPVHHLVQSASRKCCGRRNRATRDGSSRPGRDSPNSATEYAVFDAARRRAACESNSMPVCGGLCHCSAPLFFCFAGVPKQATMGKPVGPKRACTANPKLHAVVNAIVHAVVHAGRRSRLDACATWWCAQRFLSVQ